MIYKNWGRDRDGGDGSGEREERLVERVEERVEGPSRAPEVAAMGSSRGGESSGRDGAIGRGGGRSGTAGRVVVPPQTQGVRGAGQRRGNEPKDKGIASSEERPVEQGRVGITREDYAVHTDPEMVVELFRENPLLREVVREDIILEREREMAQARHLQKEEEAMRAASVLVEEFKEEEALQEAQEQEEEERVQGRVTVV